MLRLFCDRRVKADRYYVAEKEESVFVPPDILEGVGLVYGKLGGEQEPAGTAFFIQIADPTTPGRAWTYAITARHVIADIKKQSDDKKAYFRLNRKKGHAEFVETDVLDWRYHPTNPLVDVAVLSWVPPFKAFDVKVLNRQCFATDEVIAKDSIGTGDEVFIAGLFKGRAGVARSIPIVRIGNIAAMPSEPIEMKVGGATGSIPAYLIEARSLGGLSGSPVFVNLGSIRKIGKTTIFAGENHEDARGVFYLLGLVHGHWEQDVPTAQSFPVNDQSINMGIALVVPVQQIIEVLDQPSLVLERQRQMKEYKKKQMPTQDSSVLARGRNRRRKGDR